MNILAYYHYGSSPLLLILLIVLLIAVVPVYPYNRSWGYSPLGLLLIVVILFALIGCSAQSVISNQIAKDTVTAVARHYGGEEAGALASAGLSATADVLQGYVDKKPPLEIAANSPGIQGVSQIVIRYLKTKGWVSQKTVDNLHQAAQIAEHATVSTVNEGP